MSASLTESTVEAATLDWLRALGYGVLYGPETLTPGPSPRGRGETETPSLSPKGRGETLTPSLFEGERESLSEVLLARRLRAAVEALNPGLDEAAIEEALRVVALAEHPSLIGNNRAFHKLLVDGVQVPIRREDGSEGHVPVRLVDWDNPDANDWLAVNQFAVVEGKHHRRPDVVIFLNGLPVAVIELKDPTDEAATIWTAFQQIETYKAEIPSLFRFSEMILISDGLEARLGTLSSDRERFMPWRTVEGEKVAAATMPQLEVMMRGVFEKRRFLQLLRHFIVFEADQTTGEIVKKMAGYHQFHAVNRAVEETVRALGTGRGVRETSGGYRTHEMSGGERGDRRVGVVWHTQGSGKSLTMVFYAGRLAVEPAMENPTIVVLTDRNDLDDQLFGTFARCRELLRQVPAQAGSREELRQMLRDRASGGIVFTTIQKFFPPSPPAGPSPPAPLPEGEGRRKALSERRNIVVIADEAHRSQYDFIDGFARHMRDALPNASFIGFTGTPIEKTDANTRAIFGEYISVYDIQRAVEDKATVPIFYEGRLAKIALDENERPTLDEEFEEATETEEWSEREKMKTKWTALEALVGAEKRVKLIAADLVAHWEKRLDAMEGKALVVCMSRRICMDLHDQIVALRPDWHHEDDDKGKIKVVMTGSAAEGPRVAGHARNKMRREEIAKRLKDPKDPLKIVIVRDMWLTGFDAPPLHTMYVDKPMRGHGLMQAIARVNRVFRDKPGGLVVDYLGLAHELKKALRDYTDEGGKGEPAIDQEEAVGVLLREHEICAQYFHGFDWGAWITGTPAERLSLLPQAQEHILAAAQREKDPEEYRKAFLGHVDDLRKAFALAVPNDRALAIQDDVAFFQAVRVALLKRAGVEFQKTAEEREAAIRQILSRAVISDEVVDIFRAAGLKQPDISILSDEFLAEVRGMPQKNLAADLLRRLLAEETKRRGKKFLVESRRFSEMLEEAIKRYHNRAIEAAVVIEEMIALAKEMRDAHKRGETLGLSEDELAFYDALEVNDSAVKVLGEPTLQTIARELVQSVRNSVTIDWTERENARAKIRVMVKRILRKYGYPPDKQERATETVLQQAALLADEWAA